MADLSGLMATILSANVKTLRIGLSETQTEFAERLGVSQGTVARWESGSEPGIEFVVKMAALAHVSTHEFTSQLITSERRQFAGAPAGVLFLPVVLPNESALTEMFAAMLAGLPANADERVTARMLAQSLASALSATVSHPQAGIGSTGESQPRPEGGEDQPRSDPESPRGPRT